MDNNNSQFSNLHFSVNVAMIQFRNIENWLTGKLLKIENWQLKIVQTGGLK